MYAKLRSARPSHTTVVAYLGLFIALGGSAYAAVTITGKNVKNGSLTGADLKDNSVASPDIKDGSLLRTDFAAGQLVGTSGTQGPRGEQGPAGVQGPAAVNGTQGQPGLDGTALAFAYVLGSGAIYDASSKNVTAAMVSHPATGRYCFNLPFATTNAVATILGGGAPGATVRIFERPQEGSSVTVLCSATDELAVIVEATVSPFTATDSPFSILLN